MTTELLTELDITIALLEARIPASPENPQNLKLVKSFEADMAEYFRALDMAIDWNALEQLYYKNVQRD